MGDTTRGAETEDDEDRGADTDPNYVRAQRRLIRAFNAAEPEDQLMGVVWWFDRCSEKERRNFMAWILMKAGEELLV